MRGRFGTGAVALWSFALNVALTKGWLDWCPDWGVALMLAIPIMTWAGIGLTNHTVRNYLHRTNRIVAIAVFILVGALIGGAGGGVIYALLRRSSVKPSTVVEQSLIPDASIAIFVETTFTQLPITIDPRSTLNFILLRKKAPETGTWGYMTISNDTSHETEWPNRHVLEKAVTEENLTISAWRCEIRNRGKVSVQDVTIPIRYGFEPGKEWIHKAIVNPLTADEKFVFYVVNNSSSPAHAIWPSTISCRVLGEKALRQTTLQRPFKSPIEQVMIFGQSMAPLSSGWE
jgi:hypothetical protein